jgi:hypothetical protein
MQGVRLAMPRATITEALQLMFQAIASSQQTFQGRQFTIDGRLVGDFGEAIAALEYDLVLEEVSRATHDAIDVHGRSVQVIATFKESLTFRRTPDYYLGLRAPAHH